METKRKHIKQRNIKQNSKKALNLLMDKNANLKTLIQVFDLQLQTSKS